MIALLFVVMGMLTVLATAAGCLYPRLRLVEDELPDAIADSYQVAHRVVIMKCSIALKLLVHGFESYTLEGDLVSAVATDEGDRPRTSLKEETS